MVLNIMYLRCSILNFTDSLMKFYYFISLLMSEQFVKLENGALAVIRDHIIDVSINRN